jgi:hypothetical protein
MSLRAHRQFIASTTGEPLGEPPLALNQRQRRAWDDVVAACPDVLRRSDAIYIDCLARLLADWRSGDLSGPGWPRILYRMFGQAFMPMTERRRLLFPDRPRVRQ